MGTFFAILFFAIALFAAVMSARAAFKDSNRRLQAFKEAARTLAVNGLPPDPYEIADGWHKAVVDTLPERIRADFSRQGEFSYYRDGSGKLWHSPGPGKDWQLQVPMHPGEPPRWVPKHPITEPGHLYDQPLVWGDRYTFEALASRRWPGGSVQSAHIPLSGPPSS